MIKGLSVGHNVLQSGKGTVRGSVEDGMVI